MLCPEIWKFEAPKSTLKVENPENEENLLNKTSINTFYNNHLVSVVLPDSLKLPETLTDKLILDCEYYKIHDFSFGSLLDKNFLKFFIIAGNLTLLTINTRIDCDNCIGVIPTGHLILNINKATYQSLGLEGKASHFTQRVKDKYIVKINLKEDCLEPGKPIFKKIKSCLEKLGTFTVIVSWEPDDQEICPSSVAKYFSDLGYKVNSSFIQFSSNTLYSVKVPKVPFDSGNEEDVMDFVEWLGMISLDANFHTNDPGDYQSSFVTPQPNNVLGQVRFLQWRGLFSVSKVKDLIRELIEYTRSECKPWVSIYVQGFSDSTVAWGSEEHHYYTNGDNSYLITSNGAKYLLCTQKCSKKRYK